MHYKVKEYITVCVYQNISNYIVRWTLQCKLFNCTYKRCVKMWTLSRFILLLHDNKHGKDKGQLTHAKYSNTDDRSNHQGWQSLSIIISLVSQLRYHAWMSVKLLTKSRQSYHCVYRFHIQPITITWPGMRQTWLDKSFLSSPRGGCKMYAIRKRKGWCAYKDTNWCIL